MITIKLKEQLKILGKNATEMAEETCINRNTINTLVNNKIEGIKFHTLEKICQTYNLAITDIIDFAPVNQPTLAQARKLYKQEAEMVPFTIWPGMVALSKISITNHGISQNFGRMDGFFQKNYTMAYWDYDAMNRFAQMFYDLYSSPTEIDRYFSEYQLLTLKLESLYSALHEKDPAECTESEFKEIVTTSQQAYTAFWLKSFFIETFDAGFDQKEIGKIATKYSFTIKEIEVLATPAELTTSQQRKLVLLNIAFKMLNKKGPLEKLIAKNQTEVKTYKEQFDFHQSNYANVYHITDEAILAEIKDYLKNPASLKQEIKKLTNFSQKHSEEIKSVLKKHHLYQNPLYFFNKLAFFREHRKTVNLKGFHVLDYILGYIETKTGINKKFLKFLSFEEIESILKGLVLSETLEKRYKQGILVSINYDSETEIKIFEGKEAQSINEELSQEYMNSGKRSSLIKGFTASQGFATGQAKIILSHDNFKYFKPGDILVTSMTRSDFMPLIQMAAAVVTDEGGVSSHAAVTSRELNKPCIIGTNNATTAIKNGDLVEVRANHGTVRILSTIKNKEVSRDTCLLP